jgi:hypothetical protein
MRAPLSVVGKEKILVRKVRRSTPDGLRDQDLDDFHSFFSRVVKLARGSSCSLGTASPAAPDGRGRSA